jgi:dissimilatory sulfite reductase beta subunit
MAKEMREPIESGCPDGFQYMHPVMRRNFGMWKYHEHPRPGVLKHVAIHGDECWTVRAGTQRILDLFTLRKLCDIGEQYGDGYVHFTIRSNIEFIVDDGSKVDGLINALEGAGFIVGGTQNSVTMISHTQGWLHCDIPGTDASGVVKSMMDDQHAEPRAYHHLLLPDQLRRTRRYRYQRSAHQAAEDQPQPGCRHLRASLRRGSLSGGGHSSCHGQRQALPRG